MGAPNLEERVAGDAFKTWTIMRRGVEKRGVPAMSHSRYGMGWVITDSVSQYVRQALHVRKGQQDTHVDFVRKFLKATGNVVVLGRVSTYEFDVFVSENWRDHAVITLPVGIDRLGWREEKMIREAEEREPEPVVVTTIKDRKVKKEEAMGAAAPATPPPSTPMSEQMVMILGALFRAGGKVKDPNCIQVILGLPGVENIDASTVGSALTTLTKRGYITRTVKGKKSVRVEITEDGRRVCTQINRYRKTRPVLEEWLAVHGSFIGSSPRSTSEELANALGEPHTAHRVMGAIRELDEEGLVSRDMSGEEKGYLVGVHWIGDDTSDDEVTWTEPEKAEEQPVPEPAPRTPLDVLNEVASSPAQALAPEQFASQLQGLASHYAALHAEVASVDASLEVRCGNLTAALEMIRDAIERQKNGSPVFEVLGMIESVLREVDL